MAERKHKDEPQKDERNRDEGEADPEWEGFKDYVRKISQVPKEELDERLAEWERRRKEKRTG
jgi:hypothetical protein